MQPKLRWGVGCRASQVIKVHLSDFLQPFQVHSISPQQLYRRTHILFDVLSDCIENQMRYSCYEWPCWKEKRKVVCRSDAGGRPSIIQNHFYDELSRQLLMVFTHLHMRSAVNCKVPNKIKKQQDEECSCHFLFPPNTILFLSCNTESYRKEISLYWEATRDFKSNPGKEGRSSIFKHFLYA